jgi:glyoxylase-like metal-dependent hydrolase (beta-lactamase superfamily II)
MRKVGAGVFEIPILRGFVNVYLVTGDDVTIVDAGLPGRSGDVVAAVERNGASARDVATIAVTHHHIDHTGALAALQRKTSAELFTTAGEADIIEGKLPVPKLVSPSRMWTVILAAAERLGPTTPQPTEVHHRLRDGEVIEKGDLTTVFTPGHTMAHVSYLHQRSGTLFVGDAASLTPRGNLALPAANHDEDPRATVASIVKLSQLDFETACFAHGGSITRDAKARVRRFAEQLEAVRSCGTSQL